MGTGLQGQAAQGAGGGIQFIVIDRLPGGAGDPGGTIRPPIAGRLLPLPQLEGGAASIPEGVPLVLQGPGWADPIVGRHGADAIRPYPWRVVLVIIRVLGGVGAVILRDPTGHRVEPRGTDTERTL